MVVAPRGVDIVVGRAREFSVGRDVVAAVLRGSSATLLIEGAAGIGKTHLVRQIVADALDQGTAVVEGAAHALERSRPFGVIADALDLRPRSSDPRRAAIGRSLVGDSSPDGRSYLVDSRFRIVEDLLELVEQMCSRGPVVMVLEDLHWADDSSIMAINAMVRDLNHLPVAIVATLRPTPRTPSLDLLIDECAAWGASQVRLSELNGVDVDDLVVSQLQARPGPALESIVARAAGNPLLVVELLRSMASEGWLRRDGGVIEAIGDELPRTLRELVLRRLRYLPTATLELLRVAAVLGESVSVQDLAVVSERPAREVTTDLSEAFRARLLDDRDHLVAFRHQLVQQAIYEDLAAPVRRALHRHAANALAASDGDLSKVASHLLQGAEHGDLGAVEVLRLAAARAAAGSPSTALDLLRHAAQLLPTGHHEADAVSAELAAALMRAGHVAEAVDVAEAVLGRPHRDDVDAALHLTVVDALSLQNRGIELLARAEAALAIPTLSLADRALVMTQASYGQIFSGDFVGGEAGARRALELAERAGSAEMTVWSLCAASVPVKVQGRYGEALSLARRAVALAFEPVVPEARLRHPHFFLGFALADADQFTEAKLAYARAIDDADELGAGWLLPDMLALSAEVSFLTGDWDDAWTELETAMHLGEQHGQRISIAACRAYQALIATARGERHKARERLRGFEATPSATSPYGTEMVAFAHATIAEEDGDLSVAFDTLYRAWRHDVDRAVHYYDRYLAPALVRVGISVGRDEVVHEVVAWAEAGAALAPEVPTVRAAALRCRGLAESSGASLQEALGLTGAAGRVLDLVGTCQDAAAVFTTSGDRAGARDALTQARTELERLDARGWLGPVTAALRALGVRQGTRGPNRRAQAGWASLTASESAVAELVAEGLTNREMAQRLHVSPHTVNTHLRHVFQKLSVRTRAELAVVVARRAQITHSSDVSEVARSTP